MLQRILVPTDGSPLSERAIPLAESLGRAQGAELIFAQVVELPAWIGSDAEGYISANVYDDLVTALDEEARRNLDQLVTRCQQGGLVGRSALLHGSPAAGLLDYETEAKPDLVVMATHGRTGLARFALGSVADRLVREGSAPVLLARSFGALATALERVLVPLDGSTLAEEALPVVEALAGKPVYAARVLRAIASPGERASAASYLEEVADRLRAAGLQVEANVRTDEPAEAIEAAGSSADLVIMATHGRGGLDRLRHGSVAERVTRHLKASLLLVRAGIVGGSRAGASTAVGARG